MDIVFFRENYIFILMKKYIICIMLFGSFALSVCHRACSGQNHELAAFKFRKEIYISGANQELFNYPVRIRIEKDLVGRKNVEADFRDVRFVAADGQTTLAYYLEEEIVLPLARNDSGNVIAGLTKAGEATSVDFWVKIPQLPKDGLTIYLYYGNKNAVSASNSESVFLFFDDFNGSNVDKEKWLVHTELITQPFVREGVLCLQEGTVISRNFKIKEGILEFKAKAEKNASIQGIVRGGSLDSPFPIEETVYSSGYPGAEHAIAINDVAKLNIGNPIEPMKKYIYKVVVNSAGIIFERFNNDYEKQAEIRFLDTYKLSDGHIGLKASGAVFDGGSAYFDWVRVRPYANPEPNAVLQN